MRGGELFAERGVMVKVKRVLVVGTSGVGKTTLSLEIAEALGLPVHHLDLLGWQAGWVRRPKAEFERDVDALMKKDAWVVEGNYLETLSARVGRAQVLVFIDLPLWLCLVRVFGRWWKNRGQQRHDLPEGCLEPLPWTFLKWVLSAPPSRQALWRRVAKDYPKLRFVRLSSARQVDAFVRELRA